MVKVAFIGCGIISDTQLYALLKIEDAKVVAACDLSEENLVKVVEKTGAKGYSDYKEMVRDGGIDLVIINLPHGLHREATCFCAEHGIDIFLEKPMGISAEDCQEMIDCCEKHGVMFWVGHLQGYMECNVAAKKLIDSGEYGKLIGISETRCVRYFVERRPKWFLNKKMSGGGIMVNLGAHSIDRVLYLTGSRMKEVKGHVHLHEGYDVEDTAQAICVTESGVSATMNLVGNTASNNYQIFVYLTDGEIRYSPNGKVEACHADGKFETIVEKEIEPAMYYQLVDVIKVVQSDKKPRVTGEYGKHVIKTIQRIYGDI